MQLFRLCYLFCLVAYVLWDILLNEITFCLMQSHVVRCTLWELKDFERKESLLKEFLLGMSYEIRLDKI